MLFYRGSNQKANSSFVVSRSYHSEIKNNFGFCLNTLEKVQINSNIKYLLELKQTEFFLGGFRGRFHLTHVLYQSGRTFLGDRNSAQLIAPLLRLVSRS